MADRSLSDYGEEHCSVVVIVPVARPVAQTEGNVHRNRSAIHSSRRNTYLYVDLAQVVIVVVSKFRQEAGKYGRCLRHGGRHRHIGGTYLWTEARDVREGLRTIDDLHEPFSLLIAGWWFRMRMRM